MSSAMERPSAFQETETGSTLRLEWDNRRVRKDGCARCFFAVFWLVWAPVTVLVTSFLLAGVGPPRWFSAIFLIFGWTGTLGIPYSFLGTSWMEWLEISEEEICHGYEGFLAPKPKRLPLDTIQYIFLGHVGENSFVTLSIFSVPGRLGFRKQHLLGCCLAPDLKEELFDRIEAYVREKDLSLEMDKKYRNYGSRPSR